jgi:hypothetical protein
MVLERIHMWKECKHCDTWYKSDPVQALSNPELLDWDLHNFCSIACERQYTLFDIVFYDGKVERNKVN